MTIHEMVDAIAEAMLGDSRVKINKQAMTEALDDDLSKNGVRRLTKEEIEQFVMGDDDGTVPENLIELYPRVHAELTSYF